MSSKPGRINPRILILFKIVGILPVAVGSLILLNSARNSHQEETAALLSSLADNAQITVSDYLQHRIAQVAAIAVVPDVRQVVLESNPNPVTAAQEQVESEWETLDANRSPLLREVLGNAAARFLRDYVQLTPAFREIIVSDVYGRIVAATGKTSDFFQADERWWQYAYRQGSGGHYLSDIRFDESIGAHALEIAEPVIDPESNTAIGVVKAVLDSQEIFGLVNSVDLVRGQVLLIRGDGSIVASRRASMSIPVEYNYIQEVREGIAGGRRSVDVGSGENLLTVGLPSFLLRSTYPELEWYLIVEEPHSSVSGPLANINIYFLYVVLFSAGIVVVMAWIFSRILARPIIETDPHLEKL